MANTTDSNTLARTVEEDEFRIEKLPNGGEKHIHNWNILYYFGNRLHREDGPAAIYIDGSKEWWVHGNRHREDGPAIEQANGSKVWYQNGKRHREDGPAIIWDDNSKWDDGAKEWWLNSKQISKEDFTSIEMVKRMNAWELFTPKELLEMKNK